MRFFDAHAHVQFKAFDSDYREVMDRALVAGVGMINVGTQKDTSERALQLAQEHDNIYAAVGLHPIHTSASYHDAQELGDDPVAKGFTSRGESFDYEHYKKLALKTRTVAIGECGLDYFRFEGGEEVKKRQKEAFLGQIELAHEIKKPLMIHCRNAFPDLIEILVAKREVLNTPPGVVHFFTGTKEDAKKLLELGFYFTFGGVVTFTRDYDKVIEMIPKERILSETDAPYVAPVPYRGKRNEPLYVIEVVKKLAGLKDLSIEAMAAQILKNAENCFNLKLL